MLPYASSISAYNLQHTCVCARTRTHTHTHTHTPFATYRVTATGTSTSLVDESSLQTGTHTSDSYHTSPCMSRHWHNLPQSDCYWDQHLLGRREFPADRYAHSDFYHNIPCMTQLTTERLLMGPAPPWLTRVPCRYAHEWPLPQHSMHDPPYHRATANGTSTSLADGSSLQKSHFISRLRSDKSLVLY